MIASKSFLLHVPICLALACSTSRPAMPDAGAQHDAAPDLSRPEVMVVQPDECGNLPRGTPPSGAAGVVPAASRTWQQPRSLGPYTGAFARQLTFALDREGYGMALWNNENQAWSVAHTPGGGFGSPLEVDKGPIFSTSVAMDHYGGGVSAWTITGGVQAAAFASGSFMPAAPLAINTANFLALSSSGKDNAIAVWQQAEGLTAAERRGTTWSPSATITVGGAAVVGSNSQLLLDEAGNGLLLFLNPALQAINVRYGCTLSSFEGQTAVSPTAARNVSARMNGAGQAIAAWEEPGADANTNLSLEARLYDPTAGWSDVARVDAPTSVSMSSVSVARGDDGSAAVVWVQRGQLWEVWSRRYQPAAGWSDPARLDAMASVAAHPRAAIGGDGTVIAVWQSGPASLHQLEAAVALPGATFGPATAISAVLDCAAASCDATVDFQASLAMDRYGRGAAIWISPENDVLTSNSFR